MNRGASWLAGSAALAFAVTVQLTDAHARQANIEDARTMAQVAVKGFLKVPANAEFWPLPQVTQDSATGDFTVIGSVEAQNSSGAAVRNNYRVELASHCLRDPLRYECWKVYYLSIGSQVYVDMASAVISLSDPGVIRFVQNKLRGLGYQVGPSDGVIGPRTRAAIRAFQRERGLPVTGFLAPNFMAELAAP